MAAQRKKGKKSQNAKQAKPDNANAKASSKAPVSDNQAGKKESAVATAEPKPATEPAVAEASALAQPSDASSTEADSQADSSTSQEIQPETDSTDTASSSDAVEAQASETQPTSDRSSSEPSPQSASVETAETPPQATGTAESANVQLKDNSKAKGKAEKHKPMLIDEPPKPENFKHDEIRTLLVPVKPVHRLIATAISICCFAILGHLALKQAPGVNAQGLHTVDLPEAGGYVLFFRGDLQDPYGWTKDGRFRNSLQIDMEAIEDSQKVQKIEPIKDISGANFFSVAEFEVNQPGKYNLWIKWVNSNDKCKGKIYLEKDPVEKFFLKWALGIVGTISLFFLIGIPMTTQKAQATLPEAKPQ